MNESVGESVPQEVEIAESVLYQFLEDEIVLLNLANQCYYGLDDVGGRMWELLIEEHAVSKVAERLQSEFDVAPENLRADLNQLVRELVSAGLLKASQRDTVVGLNK